MYVSALSRGQGNKAPNWPRPTSRGICRSTRHMTAGIRLFMLVSRYVRGMVIAMAGLMAACSDGGNSAPASPEHAVHLHIAAAKNGDVATLRSGACGQLASAIEPRTDDEVRAHFLEAYSAGPDVLSVEPDGQGNRRIVTGYYSDATDLDIAFTVEDRDGWKVCEIRKGNGVFGPLPGPFER